MDGCLRWELKYKKLWWWTIRLMNKMNKQDTGCQNIIYYLWRLNRKPGVLSVIYWEKSYNWTLSFSTYPSISIYAPYVSSSVQSNAVTLFHNLHLPPPQIEHVFPIFQFWEEIGVTWSKIWGIRGMPACSLDISSQTKYCEVRMIVIQNRWVILSQILSFCPHID